MKQKLTLSKSKTIVMIISKRREDIKTEIKGTMIEKVSVPILRSYTR